MTRLQRALGIAATTAFVALAPAAHGDDAFTVTTAMSRRAVFSCSDFTFSDGSIDSFGISNNVIGAHGDVASNGNVKMSGGATVNGDAVAGPGKAVTNSGSSHVTGTKSVASTAENCVPVDLAPIVTAVQATNDNSRIPLTGQGKNPLTGSAHTDFTLSGGDTLALPAGTYTFTKFTLSGGSTITLSGATRILVTGRADLTGGSFVNPQPYRFRFWVSGAGPFTLSGGSSLAGFVYAPQAAATISSSRLIGAIFANQVTISGGTSHVTRAIDDLAPHVAITQPADSTVVADPAHVLVKGTASDDQTTATVQVNGQNATLAADGTFQITLNLTGASPATITAVATDLAGNTATARVTVTTTPPPNLTLSSPEPGSFVKTRVVSLSGGAGTATTVTVNGQSATVSGGVWSLANFDLGPDGPHTLTITGTNAGGSNTITPAPVVTSDTVAPTITATITPQPNAAGWNKSDVTVSFVCSDSGSGIGSCSGPVTLTTEGEGLTVTGTAEDRAKNATPLTVSINIDKTAPRFTFLTPANGATVADPRLVVTGEYGDATGVTVNGVAATLDAATGRFTAEVPLVEGPNTITATGADRAGNSGSASITVNLDASAPQLAITSPSANACLAATNVELRGTIADAHVQGVSVAWGTTTVAAALDGGNWSATVPNVAEGRQTFIVSGSDTGGHSSSASVTVNIDRTAPQITVSENAQPFMATLVNRPLALTVRIDDASPNLTITAKLDGAAYANGTLIGEGAHTLVVTAADCAGNAAPQTTLAFTVDRTPPSLSNLAPANGVTVLSMPAAISGTASENATVSIEGTAFSAGTDGSRNFSITGVPFVEGANAFVLHAVDAAGNAADVAYSVAVRASTPVVEILENGIPIAPNKLFNHAIKPSVRTSLGGATIAATLDGQPFTLGNSVTGDTAHTLTATATDAVGHSGTASVTFTIDTHGPAVKINTPATNTTIAADRVVVTGDAGDSVAVQVNSVNAALTGTTFTATVPLDPGENEIVAIGRDRAGNGGSDRITITRSDAKSGVVITWPPDTLATNRKTTLVTGRVLTPSELRTLTIESRSGSQSSGVITLTSDPSGAFQLPALALFEGANTITVTATTKSNASTAAVVHVTTDLTPPVVRILNGSDPLEEGGRYPSGVSLSVSATDTASTPVTSLQIDGVKQTTFPAALTAAGGHTAVAVATDAAKNETRVVRTFFIGAQSAAACALGNFDPKDGSVVTANSVTLVGSSGGATSVTVNGVAASVANGMFRANVELPVEGANAVTIACSGATKTITLLRVMGAPTVTIESPSEMAPFATDGITVTGTATGAISVDVNGTAAVLSNGTWSAANVPLGSGLNTLVAHATNAAGRIATASRRVLYLQNRPVIAISSPVDGFSTGAATVDVSGTYANLNPATIVCSAGGTTETKPFSTSTGRFVIRGVPLVLGKQLVTVSGHDALNRSASSAPINISRAAAAPSIVITSPADNSYVGAASVAVSGSYTATAGSQVDVNGAAATLGANNGFSATANVSGTTAIVARVTQPDDAVAAATALVTRLAAPPTVKLTFPAADAVAVDPGVVVLVSFTAPMDGATLGSAFSLVNAAGNPVTGEFRLDKDVISFAPAPATLTPGERYTIRVTTAAKDLAGNSLEHDFASSFTVGATAPVDPPQVNAVTSPLCASSVTISGTASANARLQIDFDGSRFFATANASGAWSQLLGLSAQSSYAVARVRLVGADGSLSRAAEVAFQVDCAGPQVIGAAYDRTANAIAITFSKAIDAASVSVGASGSIQLKLEDGTPVSGTAAAGSSPAIVVVTPGSPDPRAATLIVTVTTAIRDTTGRNLGAAFAQTFSVSGGQTGAAGGDGYISGQIIDGTNGRPLGGATVVIGPYSTASKTNGSYTRGVPEGAYTIHASASGYTDVWRQVVVSAGQGVVPIDIRLTARGVTGTVASSDLTLAHGGDTPGVARRATLTIPSGALPAGTSVTLTAVGAQGIAGLLPLGWSPLAAAEVRVSGSVPASSGRIAFTIPSADVAASGKALTAVAYDAARDAWRVLAPAVGTTGGTTEVTFPLGSISDVALVYPDSGSGLLAPPAPSGGGTLTGVADLCAAGCAAMHVSKPFDLNPAIVSPSGSSVATLTIDGAANPFPSGTAVDALVNEELRLVGGGVAGDVPFSTDLVLYRGLTGTDAVADFKLAPSAEAARVPLQVGFDHINILPYPGRLDRGTLVGPAGGRVPSDGGVQVEIPAGAATVALHATAKSMAASEFSSFGTIAGFEIVAGMTLTLDLADTSSGAATTLLKPASATFAVDAALASQQLILAEVLRATAYGPVVRLADRMNGLTTAAVDPAALPVDGIVRAGQYLLLRATQPIAFAFGGVRMAGSAYIANAEVIASSLGVRDVTRATGLFAIPIIAKPAASFALTPVHPTLGEGVPYTATPAPDANAIVAIGDLLFTLQTPVLQQVNVTAAGGPVDLLTHNGATEVSLATGIQAVFSQTVEASSVTSGSIVVTNIATGKAVTGTVSASGPAVTWTPASNPGGLPLVPNTTYLVAIAAGIKGSHGATLGVSQTLSFSTVTQLTNGQIHPEKIRITIPDDNGFATISGDAGALPTVPPETRAWRAVALRRGNAFITQYQVTANNDGSFSFAIGNCGGSVTCADAVSFRDHIDLEILNAAGNVAAILPLTPFVTADGQGFIAPTDAAVDFFGRDGVSVHVPAGAFDQPTVVRATRLDDAAPFAAVPSFSAEMNFYRGVNLTFDCTIDGSSDGSAPGSCVAKKRLDVSIPAPAGFNAAGKNLLLGWLGDSVRGPRVMIVDTVRVDSGGNFTTTDATGAQVVTAPQKLTRSTKQAASAAPSIDVFSATPISVIAGQQSKLTWATSNATSVLLQDLSPKEPAPPITLATSTSGDYVVVPSQTTTYRLTAVNSGTIVTQEVTIVLSKPPIGGVLTGGDIKKALFGVLREGSYAVGDLNTAAGPVGFTSMSGLQGNYDLFSGQWNALFLSHIYLNEPRARVLMPVVLGKPFEIVGFDAGTGLQAFSKAYDPLPNTDPGAAYIVPPPKSDDAGPYPVLASPVRVDVVDVAAPDVDIKSARNLTVRLTGSTIEVKSADGDPLPPKTQLRVLNVSSGGPSNYGTGTDSAVTVDGKAGDRIIIVRSESDIDPAAEISLVFNKAIYSGNDTDEKATNTFLRGVFKLEKASKPLPNVDPSYEEINDSVTYSVDSGNLRLKVRLPSSLERGAFYRLSIRKELADQSSGGTSDAMTIGTVRKASGAVSGAIPADLDLVFQVRDVADALASFNIRQDATTARGAIRDLALNGNVLLIAAMEGGVLAYDVANPAALTSNSMPAGVVEAGPNQFWSVASDEHGRVYATGLGPTFGFLQSYRIDDFFADCDPKLEKCPKRVKPRSSAIVSWAPGYGSGVDIATDTALSDRPEGIPRKLQIAVQDSDTKFSSLAAFISGTGASAVATPGLGDFKKVTVVVPKESDYKYRVQRITVENTTRDLRWSADAVDSSPATIDGIIAQDNDALRLIFNERTYGIVSIFGYGIGVFDLNAIEDNDYPTPPPPTASKWSERIRLTNGGAGQACTVASSVDTPEVIQDLSFSADSAIIPSTVTTDLEVYGLDIHRGVLDMRLTTPQPEPPPAPGLPPPPPTDVLPAPCDNRSPIGLRLVPSVSPRIAALDAAFVTSPANIGGRHPARRFAAIQTYHWTLEAQDNVALSTPVSLTTPPPGARGSTAGTRVVRDYLLLPANEYGLLVVDATKPAGWLGQENLADIIWIPAGAVSARVIPRSNLAVVVDGEGRVLLVDLSHIDERWDEKGSPTPSSALFPTVAAALAKPSPLDEDGPYGVGGNDPRILWVSKKGIVTGNVVPVIDPDTGILFAGRFLVDTTKDTALRVIPAADPRIQLRADVGKGGLVEVGGIVPLGIEPPANVLNEKDPNASLAAFRLQLTLPGAVAEAVTGSELRVALETERVAGAPSEQTPEPFPRSSLRQLLPDGKADPRSAPTFTLKREIPAGMGDALRRQRGFNRFISPWVVAIADPRAIEKFTGTAAQKKDAGCPYCTRPQRLQGKLETDGVFELWSGGRLLSVRPELSSATANIFTNTPYAYLGQAHRLDKRFAIVPGRQVRPTEALVAAQNPPVAQGMLQETTYVHSGEVETNDVDLIAGGRAGAGVVIARRHRSRTLGTSFLGEGWDSPMFRFLIPLPNGKVEYHDGLGEVWTYAKNSDGVYEAPGLFLRLTPTTSGWALIDQKWRITRFDTLGRLTSESDEFASATDATLGNTIRYLYDVEGRLGAIVDPVNRITTLEYWKPGVTATGAFAGRLKEITDWRGRKVSYEYDTFGRLVNVKQPTIVNTLTNPAVFKGRPETRYAYEAPAASTSNAPPQSQTWTDFAEFFGNLHTITDPAEVASAGGKARVEFGYDFTQTAYRRDRVLSQKWATGEAPNFDYPSAVKTTSIDALAQSREYDLTSASANDKRIHIAEMREQNVETMIFVGGLPAAAPHDLAPELRQHRTTFGYNQFGQIISRTAPDLRHDEPHYLLAPSPVGTNLKSITTSGPLLPPIETKFGYDTSANATNTIAKIGKLDGVTSKGLDAVFRDAQQPSRAHLKTTREDDGSSPTGGTAVQVTETTTWNPDGQIKSVEVRSGAGNTLDRISGFDYHDAASKNQNERARTSKAASGGTELVQTFTYAAEGQGELATATDDKRKTKVETHTDALDRVVHRVVTDAGGTVVSDESFGYDASGRLAVHTRKQKKAGDVEETFTYDEMGRQTASTQSLAQVNGAPATIRTKTTYDLFPNRQVVAFDPYTGSETIKTTSTLDGLGRTIRTERQAVGGGDVVRMVTGYDMHGAVAYETDTVRIAVARDFDLLGRLQKSVNSDGTSSEATWDAWGQVLETITRAAGGAPTSQTSHAKTQYSYQGRVVATNELISTAADAARQTLFTLDGSDSRTSVRMAEVPALASPAIAGAYRISQTLFDSAGRLIEEVSGEASGTAEQIDNTKMMAKSTYSDYVGAMPGKIRDSEPKVGATYTTTPAYDGLDRVASSEAPGGYVSETAYDEAGNPITVRQPGMKAEQITFDSRGLPVTRTLADQKSTQQMQYDERGVLRQYRDEEGKLTRYTTDTLGRVVRTDYLGDGTSEEVRYENITGVVRARRDRAGQWLSYVYDVGGRVTEVHAGEDPAASPIVMQYQYDNAGRLTLVRNKDAGIEYGEYDLLGRPHLTRSYRYLAGSGLGTISPATGEVYTQRHEWSVFDERTSWTMPVAGTSAGSDDAASSWLQTIKETRDAGSNIVKQTNAAGVTLSESFARSAGRIGSRTLSTNGSPVQTLFGFADGLPPVNDIELPPVMVTPPPGNPSGMLLSAETLVGNSRRGGSSNGRDAAARLGGVRDLSTDRFSLWSYDDRSRLADARLMVNDVNTVPTTESLLDADFRQGRTPPPSIFTNAQHVALGPIEPQRWTAAQNDAHQITQRTLFLDGTPPNVRNYAFSGGRRTSDGKWTYVFDAFGRMTTATSASEGRRIAFEWDPNDRLIGRTAYQSDGNGGWTIETQMRDGLPSESTFVWDPIVDRLVAIYAKGGGLVRQYLHGDQGYDDPIEVLAADTPGATPKRFFPIIDHAGTGSLQAVLGANGDIVERVVYADSYGDAPRYLQGPVVDKIAFDAKPDAVRISVHLDERVVASSVPGSLRLAAGSAVLPGDPDIPDPHTLVWTFTPTAWNAFTNGATTLEIAVKDTLRAEGWGNTPAQPMPTWALAAFSGTSTTPQTPVTIRVPLTTLTTSRTLYEIRDLYLAGSPDSRSKLFTGFGALPFTDPATGLVYARARWLDPTTGTFLSADPLGYKDSSNLYAYCGGDPVNCKDPRGEDAYDDRLKAYIAWYGSQTDALWQQRKALAERIRQQRKVKSDTGLLEADDRILAEKMMTFGGTPDNAALLIDFARANGRSDVLTMSFEQLHAAVLADEAVKGVGVALVTAMGPHLAQTEGINWSGGWKRVKQFASDVADAYNESVFSSEVGAIGPGVVNKPKGLDPFRIVPSKYRVTVRRAFGGVAIEETLANDLVVYRRSGGGSPATGSRWYAAKSYVKAGNARRYLALPDVNTAEDEAVFVIPAGTTILRGKAASMVGEVGFPDTAVGGGVQIYVPDPSVVRRIP